MAEGTNDSTSAVAELTSLWEEISDGLIQLLGGPEQAGTVLVALGAAGLGGALGFLLRGNKGKKEESEEEKAPELLPPPKSPEEEPESEAIIGYRQRLHEAGVGDQEREALVRLFARSLGRMENLLENLDPSDDTHHAMILDAKGALATGDLLGCIELINKAAEREYAGGREMARVASERMLRAARNKAVAGDLAITRQDHAGSAEFYAEAAGSMPDGHEAELAEILNKHGGSAYSAGELDQAIKSYERAVALLRDRPGGESNPDLAALYSNLAMLHYERADYDAAEPLYLKALEIDERALGPDHPVVAKDLNNLALLYKTQGNYKDAEPLMKRSIAIKEKHLDPSDPSLVTGLKNYSALLKALIAEDQQAAGNGGEIDPTAQRRAEKRSEAARQMEAAARALAQQQAKGRAAQRPPTRPAPPPKSAEKTAETPPEKKAEVQTTKTPAAPEAVAGRREPQVSAPGEAVKKPASGPKLSVRARPVRPQAVEN